MQKNGATTQIMEGGNESKHIDFMSDSQATLKAVRGPNFRTKLIAESLPWKVAWKSWPQKLILPIREKKDTLSNFSSNFKLKKVSYSDLILKQL
jgi:hypothetical protein